MTRPPDTGRGHLLTLRDDLFLDGPGMADVVAGAQAVVRSYEACEPEAKASALLHRALNETRPARHAAMAAPLPILAIIYFGTHHERVHAVRPYELYFERLVYMSPAREIVRTVRELRPLPGSRSGATALAHHCREWVKATYLCVSAVAAQHLGGLRGTLYLHFDLWLHPWALAALPLGSVWSLPAQRIMQKKGGPSHLLPLECFDGADEAAYTFAGAAPTSWTWPRDLPPARQAASEACRNGGSACEAGRLCIGWVDLYYVPSRLMRSFSALGRVFGAHGRHGVNHELAVPTIMNRLAPRGSTAHHTLECWGYCCSVNTCPELLLRHTCGHRMQLATAPMRRAFDDFWGGRRDSTVT